MWQKPFLATVATLSAEMQMGNATPRQVGSPTIMMLPTTLTMIMMMVLSKEVKMIRRLMKMEVMVGKGAEKEEEKTGVKTGKVHSLHLYFL